MARIFGTDGVRGLANIAPMSPEMVMELGRAAVHVLAPLPPRASRPCSLGVIPGLSSPMFEAALVAGICSAGARCPAMSECSQRLELPIWYVIQGLWEA